MCVCVFFPFILDIKFVGRTSRGNTGGRSHRISHPPSFCGACLDFPREKDLAIPFPRRPCSRILCTNDVIVLRPLGIFFFSEKNPVCRDRTHVPTCLRLHGTSELPATGWLLFKENKSCCCCCCCLHIKNRSDLYPVPFSFLLFKAKKRISVVTS